MGSSLTLPSGSTASKGNIPEQKAFLDLYPNIICLTQFEYVNPLAGLAILIIGLVLMVLGYWVYGIAPAAVGMALVLYYHKYLLHIMSTAY